MDWKMILGTGTAIFLAEIGDKTQLAVFGGAAATRRPMEIFLGAALGLLVATALGVWAGQAVGQFVPARLLRAAGGILFVAIGLWLLFSPLDS